MWLRTNPGLCVKQRQVTELLSKAYVRAATMETALSGFRATGAWPINRHIFQQHHFVAAEALQGSSAIPELTTEEENENIEEEGIEINEVTRERTPPINNLNDSKTENDDIYLNVSIEDIRPLPKPTQRESKRLKKRAQSATVLTSTPHKEEIEAARTKQNKKAKVVKRKITNQATKTHDLAKPGPSSFKQKVDIEINVNDWYCNICEKAVLEDMVQCYQCKKWFHESCALCKPGIKKYICIFCK